jgi:excisionase family DNA binding protein
MRYPEEEAPPMPDYHFTLELDGVTPAELAVPISKLADEGYDPTLGEVYNRPAVTIVVQARNPWHAVDVASDALDVLPGNAVDFALSTLPTEEHERRTATIHLQVVVSVPEAATMLGVGQQRIRQLLDRNKLSGKRVGRDWVVSRESVEKRKAEQQALKDRRQARQGRS